MALNLKKTPSKARNVAKFSGPVVFWLCVCRCWGKCRAQPWRAEETPAEALAEKRRKVGASGQSSCVCHSWWLCSKRGSSVGAKVCQSLSINVVIQGTRQSSGLSVNPG